MTGVQLPDIEVIKIVFNESLEGEDGVQSSLVSLVSCSSGGCWYLLHTSRILHHEGLCRLLLQPSGRMKSTMRSKISVGRLNKLMMFTSNALLGFEH